MVMLVLLTGDFLALFPAVVALADMPPGSLDIGFDPGTGASDLVWMVVSLSNNKTLMFRQNLFCRLIRQPLRG